MSDSFSIKSAIELATGGQLEVAATIAAYEASLVPLLQAERDLKGGKSNELAMALSALGAKVAPTMTAEQGKTWHAAMMMALSNLPGRVSVRAAREAIHVPMRFINEVEAVIREKAEPIEARHREAIHRLRRLLHALENPPQNLLAAAEGYEDGNIPDLSDEEVIESAKSDLGRSILKIGIAKGYLAQERYDCLVGGEA